MAQLTSRHMTPRPNKRALTKLEHAPTVVSGRYSIGWIVQNGGKPANTQRHGAGGPMLGIHSHHIVMQGNILFQIKTIPH